MFFRQIVDGHLAQNAYLIGCQKTGEALIIDPERDIDRYMEIAAEAGLRITGVTETHIHADFLSGAREFAARHDVTLYLSDEGGEDWRYRWIEGGDYDVVLLKHGDRFGVGNIEVQALHTPGHTPEHMSFLITDRGSGSDQPMGIATGDFVFVGDLGRPDLLETAAGQAGVMRPSAQALYGSLERFLELPDHVQVWPAHGAGSACGKALGAVPTSTVGYERLFNPSLRAADEGQDAFVDFILEGQPEPPLYFARMKRLNRDGVPVLGRLPQPEHMTPGEFAERVRADKGVVVDTRRDRRGFMGAHFPGSLYAPYNKSFPTLVGSYVQDEPIYLVAEHGDVDGIVRDLIRIGYDNVVGYIDLGSLGEGELQGLDLVGSSVVNMIDVEQLRRRDDHAVVDVRGAVEFSERHVPGAVNIAHTRLLDRLADVPRDRKLLVYCRSGQRAAAAVALLEREGHEAILVDDWFENWEPAETTA